MLADPYPVKIWRIFWEKFYYPHSLAEGKYHIWITEKMLELRYERNCLDCQHNNGGVDNCRQMAAKLILLHILHVTTTEAETTYKPLQVWDR